MKLNDICELIIDCPHTTSPDEGEGYPLIRTPNIGRGRLDLEGVHRVSEDVYFERTKRGTPQDNDIIFAREAPAGNAAIIKNRQKVCLGQRTVLIRPDIKKVDPDYLTYYILAPEQQYKLLGTANGATVAHVNLPTIRNMPVELPSIASQRKIGSQIKAYDDLIENNRKQIKLLEEAAQRLYKEWFIDLRFPGHEHTKIEDGVPEGWAKSIFSEKVEIMSGGTPDTTVRKYYEGDIPFYSPKDSDDSFFSFDTEIHISEEGLEHCNSKLYPAGTIIITARGTVGKTTILAKPMAMNQSCYALRSDTIPSEYLFFALRSEIDKLRTMANGGVFNTIIVKTFDNIEMTLPGLELLDQFNKTLEPIMNAIKAKIIMCNDLTEARDRLLTKLLCDSIKG